jgi:hypothetical protein
MVGAKKVLSIVPTALYSTVQLASYLQVQPRTLETWRRRKTHPELRYRRVGRRVRYLGQDILNFINDDVSPQPKRKRQGAR